MIPTNNDGYYTGGAQRFKKITLNVDTVRNADIIYLQDSALASFDKCPACGCQEAIARKVGEEELTKGNIPWDAKVFINRIATPIVDLRGPIGRSVSVIITYYDICLRCGCYYCVRVEKVQGVLERSSE